MRSVKPVQFDEQVNPSLLSGLESVFWWYQILHTMAETRGSEVLVIWRLMCTKGTVPHLLSYHPAKLLPKGTREASYLKK